MSVNTRRREISQKNNLKIAGGIAALVLIIGLVSTILFYKNKVTKQAGELAEKDATILVLNSKAEESRLIALPIREFSKETPAALVTKGEVATKSGWIRTQIEEARCLACIKFQAEFEPTLKRIIKAKNIAEFNEELSLRKKRKWKTIALVGIPAGILTGIVVDQLVFKK